jgi:MFS family permease
MAFISDRFGRKPPARFSGFGMFLSMMGLAICVEFPVKETSLNWIPSFLLLFFIFSSTLGFLTLPFSMIAEMYPQNSRGFAAGLTICAGYFMSFINIKAYPILVENVGNKIIFLFYGFVSLLGVFFVHFFLIETRGKTLQEIENHFRGKTKPEIDIEMLPKQ